MTELETTVEELAARLREKDPSLVLLDVRTDEEHAFTALPGSLHVPLHELPGRQEALTGLAGKDVVVYCHHGVRSLSGAGFLRSLGVSARSLAGGIDLYALRIDPSVKRY